MDEADDGDYVSTMSYFRKLTKRRALQRRLGGRRHTRLDKQRDLSEPDLNK